MGLVDALATIAVQTRIQFYPAKLAFLPFLAAGNSFINDGPGTGPGNPGNKGGAKSGFQPAGVMILGGSFFHEPAGGAILAWLDSGA